MPPIERALDLFAVEFYCACCYGIVRDGVLHRHAAVLQAIMALDLSTRWRRHVHSAGCGGLISASLGLEKCLMARYSSYYRSEYAYRRMSDRIMLALDFAGIDEEIERIFLSLPRHHLEDVFARYQVAHGTRAEAYARRTYKKWQSGAVKMSGLIAGRLLDLIPLYLPADVRFDLVKKLRSKHFRPVHRTLMTTPQTWRQDLAEPIRELVTRSTTFALPKHVTDRATWLTNGDTAAAHSLLAAAEQEEAIIRIRYLEAEFKRLEAMIANIEHTRSVAHTISLPQGTINVTIAIPKQTLWQSITSWFS